jgi:hypothetical protein
MTKRAIVLLATAVFVCTGISAASAQINYSPAKIIKVQSDACSCREDCFDIDCSDFCADACRGPCAARYHKALNACLRRCGRCTTPR